MSALHAARDAPLGGQAVIEGALPDGVLGRGQADGGTGELLGLEVAA